MFQAQGMQQGIKSLLPWSTGKSSELRWAKKHPKVWAHTASSHPRFPHHHSQGMGSCALSAPSSLFWIYWNKNMCMYKWRELTSWFPPPAIIPLRRGTQGPKSPAFRVSPKVWGTMARLAQVSFTEVEVSYIFFPSSLQPALPWATQGLGWSSFSASPPAHSHLASSPLEERRISLCPPTERVFQLLRQKIFCLLKEQVLTCRALSLQGWDKTNSEG